MPKNLVIVESPAKAKTIAKYLGSDFSVKSSFGHIRDLPKKNLGVDVGRNFQPTYETSPDKKKVVNELKAAAKQSTVWLASDEDREGEAIAWHVSVALGLDPDKTKRIVFHEITKPAIEAAVAKPRTIDMKLVDAQQSRRILDRLVGYELSPVLWKKIRAGLSAGRVQSVAVRLIVERERQIRDFKPKGSFKVNAVFEAGDQTLEAELDRNLADEKPARQLLENLSTANFSIASIDKVPGNRSPSPPFTTSTLQQEAARRLGYGVRQTMTLAQRLYENGHITYMRTDSTTLSHIAIKQAEQYIQRSFGQKYSLPRQYKTKSRAAQEAHEAIRPTSLTKTSAGADSAQRKLYELIWRRAVASQMSQAAIRRTTMTIDISNYDSKFLAEGEVLVFDGFMKVYGGGKQDKILPDLKVGQSLKLNAATALQILSKPPGRYSEASLVRKLEQLGIGRPSTYAPTISTVQDRGYVEKKDVEGEIREVLELALGPSGISDNKQTTMIGNDRSKLVPTALAEIVTDFLNKYFADIIDYDFTARAEAQLDEVADGKISWQEMLREFYEKFHPLVERSAKADRSEASQARQLGIDPKTGKPVIARFSRYGPMLQLGDADPKDKDAPKPKFAPLPEGASLDDVTLEQALPMFQLPRQLGTSKDGQPISADIGRYGPYIKVGSKFISLKEHDPLSITLQQALKITDEQQEQEAKRVIADFGKLKVLRGPYGPYVTDGKKNARVPKSLEPEQLDESQAAELLQKVASGRSKAGRNKKR